MIHTSLCDLLGIDHPVVLAGMGGATNAELVAAVSEAGGLGILACTWRATEDAVQEIRRIRTLTGRPFGVNFVLHQTQEDTFHACLDERVPVFSFFRGDPKEATARAHDTGAKVINQITTVAEAEDALAVGVDVLIAQGVEAGGHMGPIPLMSILPEVVAIAGDHPVLAAGGIVDGRGLAAVLCLGASGVLMGTRFLATLESSAWEEHKQAILDAQLGDTVASTMWDMLWGTEWPGGIRVRALRNQLTDRWAGREDELLEALETVQVQFQQANAEMDMTKLPLLTGEGGARIHDVIPAAQVVCEVMAEAEQIIHRVNGLLT
jgi:NAD(P)H-dependent flavin oxidoreductase YrpB (nitropropane dioxygenase family)